VLRQCRANSVLLSGAALILAAPGTFAQTTPSNAQPAADSGALTEITVTAQRRTQTVQDIPYNISVVGAADITNSGATNINDLSRIVNGLVTVDQGPAARAFQNDLTLRGLRTDAPGGGSSETYIPTSTVNAVSTYFGETPIFFPMVLEDIDRVEVLRGPQGTLYGSGAEAGTIRVIPNRPDLSAFAAEISATGSYTEFANRPNENVHGMVNIPVSDTLALRLVAGYEHLAGFIKAVNLWELDSSGVPIPSIPGNLSSGPVIGPEQRGVNSSNQGFERIAVRWKPAEAVDIQFDYLHQSTTQADPQVSTPFWHGGCLNYASATPLVFTPTCAGAPPAAFYANAGGPYTTAALSKESYGDTVDLGSIVATVDLGFANFTSVTSYDKDSTHNSTNLEQSVLPYGINAYPPYNGYPRTNDTGSVQATDRSFVEELRLASNGKHLFDYVVGGFYQRELRSAHGEYFVYGQTAYNDSIGMPPPSSFGDLNTIGTNDTVYSDKAVFGELTAHITDAWQVTGGLRLFRDAYSLNSVTYLPGCGAACSADLVNPNGLTIINADQEFSGHLKKFNSSYDISPDTKVYVTYSEGFRRGGSNGVPINGPFAALPEYQTFTPDFAKNYEVGIKGSLLDRRLRYSASIYRIDLDNFQFNAYSLAGGYSAVYNGSSARTKGIETEVKAAVTESLTLSVGYTYTDARTTSAVQKSDLVTYALIPAYGGTGPTDTAPFLNIASGVRLPGVPKNTATFGIDYMVPEVFLGQGDRTLLLHADTAYRSSAPGYIDISNQFYWKVPSSMITNVRASLSLNQHLGFDLFANNITSNTAYSGAAYSQTIPNPYQLRNVARPRTVGITLRYKF
jgi:outer membrane receptor protein involved in Fe transport